MTSENFYRSIYNSNNLRHRCENHLEELSKKLKKCQWKILSPYISQNPSFAHVLSEVDKNKE